MRPSGVVTLFILFIYGLEAAPLSCPKSCTCTDNEFNCKSFTFLKTLSASETAITKLVINNTTSSTNPQLNNLQNLKSLNLASNKIKRLNSLYFPKSVEYLDLSHNFITILPQDFSSRLVRLKELRLTGNPISCTCDSITIRDQLLQNNVIIATPVKCHSPENLQGKSWLAVSCVRDLFGEMQGDAPFEGSGFEEVVTESDDKSFEEEFIRVDAPMQDTKPNVTKIVDDTDEGSGNSDGTTTTPLFDVEDEDKSDNTDNDSEEQTSDTEPPMVSVNDLLLNNVKACNFDCSTPAPPENDTDALPPPNVFEGVKIVLDDINILKGVGTTPLTTKTPTPTVTPEISNQDPKKTDAEVLSKQIAEQDKGKITEETQQANSSTYIFLGALFVLIVALVVYAIIKKRSARRRSHSLNRVEEKVTANEVELLRATKPSNGTHEVVPLMNGHSDKDATPYEDVELRQKPNEQEGENTKLLVPETKRVTIKASEIPNSTPKTPVLVTRHLDSDGSIVTTPTIHQKV